MIAKTSSRLLAASALAVFLSGCLAKTAVDVATAPVRAASQAADWATTSQDEADRNRGREIRRREERLGDMQEDYEELEEDCLGGNDEACREAVAMRNEMIELQRSIPVEPED